MEAPLERNAFYYREVSHSSAGGAKAWGPGRAAPSEQPHTSCVAVQ